MKKSITLTNRDNVRETFYVGDTVIALDVFSPRKSQDKDKKGAQGFVQCIHDSHMCLKLTDIDYGEGCNRAWKVSNETGYCYRIVVLKRRVFRLEDQLREWSNA